MLLKLILIVIGCNYRFFLDQRWKKTKLFRGIEREHLVEIDQYITKFVNKVICLYNAVTKLGLKMIGALNISRIINQKELGFFYDSFIYSFI